MPTAWLSEGARSSKSVQAKVLASHGLTRIKDIRRSQR
jgi:hypothetical protein